MKKILVLIFIINMFILSACSQNESDEFILVEGGSLKNTNSNYFGKDVAISDFYLGKYEVTQKEWEVIMGDNPSTFKGADLPVEMVNWYDCIEYCNKRSLKEGLDPYYNIDKTKQDPDNISEDDELKWLVTINEDANGYRLPMVEEWEYAASGGQKSKNHKYSGSNDINEVAWYWINAGDKELSGSWNWSEIENNNNRTHPVGEKKANELGFYDMSGNVREWCWEWNEDDPENPHTYRTWKGGGFIGGDGACELSLNGPYRPINHGYDQGFRLCRNK